LKLLVDENLPPRLVHNLSDLFPGSVHVQSVGFGSTPDELIWEYAQANGFVFPTKDKDFASLSLARGAPPKVILLQTGNCSTDEVLYLLQECDSTVGVRRRCAASFADPSLLVVLLTSRFKLHELTLGKTAIFTPMICVTCDTEMVNCLA